MHKAIVAKVTEVQEIPGAEKIQVAIVLGERVIVSKDVGVGYVGVLFPVGLQLSHEFCHENNLYRHSSQNKDTTKAGFFEDSRRVRAQPFLGVRSEGYFTDIKSLEYATISGKVYDVGFTFDELNGIKICEKYISQATKEAIAKANRPKAAKKTLAPYFEKHVDSEQFKHNAHLIPVGALLSFHAKVHGTSHRCAYTKVAVELPKWKQWVNKILPVFPTEKWDYVTGTRNVVLTTPEKEGFHGSEAFRFEVTEMLKPHMKKGMTIYGEIAGYANGKPIMAVHSSKATKDKAFQKKYGDNIVYKYGCAEHEYRFHVYRIAYLSHEGENIDMSQAQIEQWCKDRGINYTYEVAPQVVYDGNVDALMQKVTALTEEGADVNGADWIDPSHPTEGIIVRVDTGKQNPYFLKSKNYYFKVMEGICDAVDTEDMEAA